MTNGTVARIRAQFERMRELTRSAELSSRNERISAWCLAEQIDHVTRVTASVVEVLADPNAPALPRGVNFVGRLVLRLGWIPRGVGKTPKRLTGTPASATDLDGALARLAEAFEALPFERLHASRVPVIRHPKFGGLTPPQALRFLVVHTHHHLKIVDDILR
ncbi:MAG TPA: DinB family protein [Thermoanaerobaculia bacterium]|nr:DinB family protein [Thermoanaerobaculia bacterium]